jgi:hypothetical protein
MRWNGFARSLLFAALAAGAYPVFALLLNPVFGRAQALSLYLIGIVVVYVAGLAPRRTRAIATAGIASVLGVGVLVLAPSIGTIAVGAALIVAVCRSGVLYRSRKARALVAEICLLAGGLGLARFLAGPDTLQVAFAIWGFFLAQSFYFLLGGIAERAETTPGLDPFEVAHTRALALMEGDV